VLIKGALRIGKPMNQKNVLNTDADMPCSHEPKLEKGDGPSELLE
jgi:hypothetical protein